MTNPYESGGEVVRAEHVPLPPEDMERRLIKLERSRVNMIGWQLALWITTGMFIYWTFFQIVVITRQLHELPATIGRALGH